MKLAARVFVLWGVNVRKVWLSAELGRLAADDTDNASRLESVNRFYLWLLVIREASIIVRKSVTSAPTSCSANSAFAERS